VKHLFAILLVGACLVTQAADKPVVRTGKVTLVDPATGLATLQLRPVGAPASSEVDATPIVVRFSPGDVKVGYAGREIALHLMTTAEGPRRADTIFPNEPESLRRIAEISDSLHRETLDKGRLVTRMPADLMPNMALWDQDGRLVMKKDFLGAPLALNFIFTSCRSARMCPASTACMKQLADLLAKQPAATKVRLLTITFDPETDSPGLLRTYADGYGIDHGRHRFLTGDPVQIKDLMRHYGIQTLRDDGTIVHNAALLLISAEGRILQRREGASFDPEDVAKALVQATANK
jgi:protein SCO1/2